MVLRPRLRGCEAEIRQEYIVSKGGNQNVLGLEVPVVYPQTVAMFHGIQDLEEDAADRLVSPNVPTLLGDVGEEVPLGTVVQHHVGAIRIIHDLEHGDYIRVCRGSIVQLDLPGLEFSLSPVQRLSVGIELVQGLDGIGHARLAVVGFVDHSIRTGPNNAHQFQGPSEDVTYP